MTVTGIKNRLGRLEEVHGIGRLPVVIIGPFESEDAAYARAGVRFGETAQVLRVRLVSAAAGR